MAYNAYNANPYNNSAVFGGSGGRNPPTSPPGGYLPYQGQPQNPLSNPGRVRAVNPGGQTLPLGGTAGVPTYGGYAGAPQGGGNPYGWPQTPVGPGGAIGQAPPGGYLPYPGPAYGSAPPPNVPTYGGYVSTPIYGGSTPPPPGGYLPYQGAPPPGAGGTMAGRIDPATGRVLTPSIPQGEITAPVYGGYIPPNNPNTQPPTYGGSAGQPPQQGGHLPYQGAPPVVPGGGMGQAPPPTYGGYVNGQYVPPNQPGGQPNVPTYGGWVNGRYMPPNTQPPPQLAPPLHNVLSRYMAMPALDHGMFGGRR